MDERPSHSSRGEGERNGATSRRKRSRSRSFDTLEYQLNFNDTDEDQLFLKITNLTRNATEYTVHEILGGIPLDVSLNVLNDLAIGGTVCFLREERV